nr:2Fe-2S iron-sulfur cluster-binding protein [Ancylothrix sp. D3o]
MAGNSGESILELVERAGVELPSSCRGGNCGTCKQQLLEGNVEYDSELPALSVSERQQGIILACSARPVGKVVIDA